MGLSILLVEDEPASAKALKRFLGKEGHHVEHADTGEDGVRMFEELTPDLVLQDLRLPGIDGIATLERIKAIDDQAIVIVITGHGSIESAVEAMRLGALDYITKPMDLSALTLKLEQVSELIGLRSDLGYLLERERRAGGFESFIGSSAPMRAVYDKIREVAKTDNTTVLVTGQSGTGKELVARSIHARSTRSRRPLMQIDCTAIPLQLLESELMGHERGAFTGADQQKKGLLELADGGTLLLDEIGDMDLTLQGKFLRVLQERQFRRVGGTRDLRFDVRVIAATNQDLDELSTSGGFRRDLLFRLKVFQIELPPLAERGADIVELATAFVADCAARFHKPVLGLDPEAEQALLSYDFPGNVRELKNIIEQAVILAKGETVTAELLSIPDPDYLRQPAPADPGGPRLSLEALGEYPLQAAETELIRQALAASGGKKNRAAQLLGISRFAFQRKLEKLAVDLLGKSAD